jgi:hypothetical protein
MLFEIQVDDDPGLVAADIGTIGNFIAGSGNDATRLSGYQLDHSTLGASAGQLRVIDISQKPGGNEFARYAKAVVRIALHGQRLYDTGTVPTGV